MIFALWQRWLQHGHFRWLAILMALLVVDLFVGSALVAWEIRLLREAWGQ